MKLNANPFHPKTGELLPAYRDAYLRGDLSSQNTEAVDAYMKTSSQHADAALRRFYEMKQHGHQVRAVGWVQWQFEMIRKEPQRFRRRAASLIMGSALVGGAVFAGTNLPSTDATDNVPLPKEILAASPAEAGAATAATSTMRLVLVRGRILDENGKPLVGATVLDRTSGRGVSTDVTGSYAIQVPANQTSQLQYGYGGYTEEEVRMKGVTKHDVTLLPRDAATALKTKRHWWQF